MPLTAPEILGVAGQLLDDHRPPPELPVDLAVHAAVALAGEHPRYTELSCSDGRRRLVFTLVTSTRVLQLSVPEDRESDADGADVATDVWPLETLEELRLLPPRPRSAAEDPIGPVRTRWRDCRWQLDFSGGPPVQLPAGAVSSTLQRRAAADLVGDLLVAHPPANRRRGPAARDR